MSNTTKRRFAQNELDDLVMLDSASESRIVDVQKNRYGKDIIYTNIGPVLIAINPFKTIPSLYTEARIRETVGKKYYEMPPHPYAVIEEAYSNMNTYRENQCIVISGESGSGKTETAKIIMQYISSVSGKGSDLERVKNRLLSSNPILEGFGNAKTINNNNSSRFAKYMVLNFNYAGEAVGGHVNNYLLEKSRVVGPASEERNFHVFYQITKGISGALKDKYYIESPDYYRYLGAGNGGCIDVAGIDDVADWKEMQEAMNTIGITPDEKEEIIRTLSIILWLGNVDFVENQKEESSISDPAVAAIVAHLMQVDQDTIHNGLCVRTITAGGVRGESYKKPCRKEEAEFNRDTLAKAMYSKLFDYLVAKVNQSIYCELDEGCHIGILDVFGFEIFEHNSFEQLLINYLGEQLQQIFIELTFKQEQEEYAQEGIPWTPVQYVDNKPVVDLVEGRVGLLSLLDDACSTSKDDRTFVHNLSQQFAGHQSISTSQTEFTIQHYAGAVKYDGMGFMVKNKDTLFDDLVVCLQKSPCNFVNYHGWNLLDTSAAQKARPPTVGKVFREQVRALISALKSCSPHYIRCIKPNHSKQSGKFDTQMITRQVQYLGLLENVRVTRAGFAFRNTFERFGHRYGIVCDEIVKNNHNLSDSRRRCELVAQQLGWELGKQYAMGKTKIFIREAAVLFSLEDVLERKISSNVAVLQSAYRQYLHRRRFQEVTACAYDVMKTANKQRRRASVTAGVVNYRGDYINTRNCAPLKQLLSQYAITTNNNAAGISMNSEEIVFADKVSAVQLKEKKGLLGSLFGKKEGLTESRLFVCTTSAMYLYSLIADPQNKQGTIVKLYWRVEHTQIKSIEMSNLQDGFLLFRFVEQVDIKDALLLFTRKVEFLATMRHAQDYPGVSGPRKTVPVSVVSEAKVLVNAKKQSYINISWVENSSLSEEFTIVKDKESKQDVIITVGGGVHMSTVAEPYRPTAVNYASGGRIAMRVTTKVDGNGVDELSLKVGDVVYVVRDDDKGWMQCETSNGHLGWVENQYLEFLDQSMKRDIPPKPQNRPPPPKPATTNKSAPPPPNRNPAFGAVLNQWSNKQ